MLILLLKATVQSSKCFLSLLTVLQLNTISFHKSRTKFSLYWIKIPVNMCNCHIYIYIYIYSSSNVYLSFVPWVIVSGTGHFKGFASLCFIFVWINQQKTSNNFVFRCNYCFVSHCPLYSNSSFTVYCFVCIKFSESKKALFSYTRTSQEIKIWFDLKNKA